MPYARADVFMQLKFSGATGPSRPALPGTR